MTDVMISSEARVDLTNLMRDWSGWSDASLAFVAVAGGLASTNRSTHAFTADPDRLVLNPNRVLRTITPFRLRQEGVLTGAMLHEAGHARHSMWRKPRAQQVHLDGSPVADATVALALLMEEARCEARMVDDVRSGLVPSASTLTWTMRASAAAVLPRTQMSVDPDQAVMDAIHSWALRAGRQYGLVAVLKNEHTLPGWVQQFTSLVHKMLVEHLVKNQLPEPSAQQIMSLLIRMAQGGPATDHNTWMVDTAKEVLDLLYPETPEDERPQAGDTGCDSEGDEDEDTAEEDSEGGSEPDEDEDGESEDDDADSPADGDSEDGETPGNPADAALNHMEDVADEATEQECEDNKTTAKGLAGGAGGGNLPPGNWREPTAAEREVKRNAVQFLRDVIAPSDTVKHSLSESPSSAVDGAALAAWNAGGQVRDPRFFKRTRHITAPASPVKIAVLVDISSSMTVLQEPSALLSWALASAAIDLRNFAGRGVQVESTLIHWGDRATVLQANGAAMPGIFTDPCDDGTRAMSQALALVEQEIPGFYDHSATPENRLLVQFTDWELFDDESPARDIGRALAAGVNMLSVVPKGYTGRAWSKYADIMARAKRENNLVGEARMIRYDPRNPEAVWSEAATLIDPDVSRNGETNA